MPSLLAVYITQAYLVKSAGPLLQAAAQLIRHFPVFRDVVVSVARKTDAQMWPALFAAVGSPGALLEALLDVGALQSAACCLLIVDRIQGQHEAHGLALRLIQVCCCLCHGTCCGCFSMLLVNVFHGSTERLSPGMDIGVAFAASILVLHSSPAAQQSKDHALCESLSGCLPVHCHCFIHGPPAATKS